MILQARNYLGTYERAEMMIQAGLYSKGSDPRIDAAIRVWADLDMFIAEDATSGTAQSFEKLFSILSLGSGEKTTG